jgi:hypothetical protein
MSPYKKFFISGFLVVNMTVPSYACFNLGKICGDSNSQKRVPVSGLNTGPTPLQMMKSYANDEGPALAHTLSAGSTDVAHNLNPANDAMTAKALQDGDERHPTTLDQLAKQMIHEASPLTNLGDVISSAQGTNEVLPADIATPGKSVESDGEDEGQDLAMIEVCMTNSTEHITGGKISAHILNMSRKNIGGDSSDVG